VKTGTVTTSEDGRFAYRIAKGPSRTIRFAYKAYTLDPAPVQTATLSLGVKAGIKLKLTPRRVTNGQKVRFKGRLKGGPARKGTRVTIDVLVPTPAAACRSATSRPTPEAASSSRTASAAR
jgi:hypothetical protein